jgi:hypothetical protein
MAPVSACPTCGRGGLLLDCRAIMDELGVTRATAEAIMRKLPKVHPDGIRKVYVRRDDLERYLADGTRRA